MPNQLIETNNVDIYKYPTHTARTEAAQLTIGDLHANAMLLMYFLVSTGVVTISVLDYAELVRIYRKDTLTADDLSRFNALIDALTITQNTPLIRFIGDEICDRGQNDYFIFKILHKLKQSGIKSEILLSNHGIEFLIPYEQAKYLAAENINFEGQARSLNRMRYLIENHDITIDTVSILVQDSYLPQLKLLSYSLEGQEITIYSHAGIGLEIIPVLAKKFDVEYQDNTAEALARTIEAINMKFTQYVRERRVHTLPVDLSSPSNAQHDIDPVKFLLWNRDYSNLIRHKRHNGYSVAYVHGHDSRETSHDNILNLDGSLGKFTEPSYGREWHKGTLLLLEGQGAPLMAASQSQQTLAHGSAAASQIAAANIPENIAPNPVAIAGPVSHEGIDRHSQPSVAAENVLSITLSSHLDSIHDKLADLNLKIQNIDKEKNNLAYVSALSLYNELNSAYSNYSLKILNVLFGLNNNKSIQNIVSEFKISYENAFNNTRTLSTDLGWGDFLINMLKVFANAIISVANSVVALTTGREGFFAHYQPARADSAVYNDIQSMARNHLDSHVYPPA